MVVRCHGTKPCTRDMIGRAIVKVVMPLVYEDGTWWTLAEPVKCPNSSHCHLRELPDAILQPIRGEEGEHPGDVTRNDKSEFTPKQQTKRLDWVGPLYFS